MTDAIPFATDAWIKRLGEECNNSEAYRHAAKDWEGDLYIIIEPEGPLTETIYMYLDLYHGECRQAFIPEDYTSLDPAYTIRGRVSVWKDIADKKIDPVKAILTRKLSVTGNMARIMKNVKAANELVNCTTRIETVYPFDVDAL